MLREGRRQGAAGCPSSDNDEVIGGGIGEEGGVDERFIVVSSSSCKSKTRQCERERERETEREIERSLKSIKT